MTARQRSFLEVTADTEWRHPAKGAAQRAAAARRLPPYLDRPSGDSLVDRDPLARTTRRTLSVEVGRRTAWLTGSGVIGLLDRVGSPRQYDSKRRVWMCPIAFAADVIAAAEHVDRRPTIVRDVDR